MTLLISIIKEELKMEEIRKKCCIGVYDNKIPEKSFATTLKDILLDTLDDPERSHDSVILLSMESPEELLKGEDLTIEQQEKISNLCISIPEFNIHDPKSLRLFLVGFEKDILRGEKETGLPFSAAKCTFIYDDRDIVDDDTWNLDFEKLKSSYLFKQFPGWRVIILKQNAATD